jgi:hypothetical protein
MNNQYPVPDQTVHSIFIVKELEVAAPPQVTFESVLAELGPEGQMPDGNSLKFKLEPWPGGRWYRDLGENRGHFWGHVQVIKPPTLLEICGPFFMSYPGLNFVQYRLTPAAGGTLLKITHRAMGQIPREDREGVVEGWEHGLKRIRQIAESRAAATQARR